MSNDWVDDIFIMHDHYGHHEAFDQITDKDKLKAFLKFRIDFLQEELDEMRAAKGAEDVVDALIDLIVVAIGTLDQFSVDSHRAWNEVLKANMAKESGVNPSRPNEFGLPDLIKPAGWTPPSHAGNHGTLPVLFEKDNVVPFPCAV